MRKLFLIVLLSLLIPIVYAQRTDYPLIGAQVFVEPGQTEADIEQFFRILHDADMKVARIRLFGSHMLRPDGTWDFSLYGKAFDLAAKYDVKLFATLFPPTDELSDVGGFKFPRSKAHLEQIAGYIRAMVGYFSCKPALYAWVLQNEPGGGGSVVRTDLSDEVRNRWERENPPYRRGNGYLKANFDDAHFQTYYTTWYLHWIADQIRQYDTAHYTHVNPHGIFETLAEYDFPAYESFLTSLGVSMHASWHFTHFERRQYPLGVSFMSDIIRAGAGRNPFWITELQGGGVVASGSTPLCPTASEIEQWIWTGIGAGAQGVIFWTLNPRKAVMESGEWAMIDYLRQPTDRLNAAAGISRLVSRHADFFRGAEPVKSGVAILYNHESLLAARYNAEKIRDGRNEGRQSSAVLKSALAAYEAIAARGIIPEVLDMRVFDWDPSQYPLVILPNLISVSHAYLDDIERYVRAGGRLIVTGMTGYYDENMACLFMDGFPLRKCFGAVLMEFRAGASYFDFPLMNGGDTLRVHRWKGVLHNDDASVIASDAEGVTGVKNRFGKGTVVWIPSLVDLGGWQYEEDGLEDFYWKYGTSHLPALPVRFVSTEKNVLMRLLRQGDSVMAILVNKNDRDVTLRVETDFSSAPLLLYGHSEVTDDCIPIPADGVVVCLWKR